MMEETFKLALAQFIDMSSLSTDSAINIASWEIRKDFNSLTGCQKHGPEGDPH